MWCRSYRNHVIMAFPSFDTVTNSWAPQADISWPTGPARESEFVRFSARVLSESEAVAWALSRGKSWIDRRLKHYGVGRREVQGRLSQTGATLRYNSGGTGINRQLSAIEPKKSSNRLTFDQFKSAVTRPGVKLSEQSLQKSYAALMKLRKSRHCSWAEIKSKVKQSQARFAPTKASETSSVRLPLTQRDWRRMN
jgi:hypothetical protein